MITHSTIVYFSPANHTQQVSNWLMSQLPWPTTLLNITANDMHCQTTFDERELVIFAVPSFGGRVPHIALQKFQECSGSNTPCVLLVTYGNRAYDDTLLELQRCVEPLGFQPYAALAVVCEHSIMHSFASHRPDDKDYQQLKGYLERILHRLHTLQGRTLSVPGTFPFKEYHGIPLKPKTSSTCTSCGVCSTSCPTGAIDPTNPGAIDKDCCISCMRCVTICPVHAKEVNQLMVKASTLKMKKACSDRKESELFL